MAMGLCKCPKRKVTNLFCFEHRVNVCEHCLVSNHNKVSVWNQCIMHVDCIKRKNNRPLCSLPCNWTKAKISQMSCLLASAECVTRNHSLHSSDQVTAVTDDLSSLFFSNKQLIKTLKVFIFQCKKKKSMISKLCLAIHQGVIKMS